MNIPEHKIHEIREATDVVDLISGYVSLKKKGQNFFGLCPFHSEKTPSFSVNPDKQIFHCFGCGAGGNVFTFLMRHEGIGFPDAAKLLAQRAGIQLEFEEQDESVAKENEALFHINEFAARAFQDWLVSAKGVRALHYLKKRGLSETNIKEFGLGYAQPGWDNLIRLAKETANDIELVYRAGLILEKEKGRYYDRFRDRIMFPIWNLSGKVVAFGGRILQAEENSPKYINSPETAVYEKGKILYGLYQNRDAIRHSEKAIFVEGYMDLLSLVAADVKNVVATSGTALTENQARLILRYTRNVVLMYDSDTAGVTATMRGADILLENGLNVFIATLPEGHDPDSFVREFGTSAVLEQVSAAQNFFDYRLNLVLEQSAENRTEGIRSLLNSLAKLRDRIQRSLLLSKLSEKLEISEKILWGELEAITRQNQRGETRRSTIGERLNELSKVSKVSKVEKAVEDLVRILIHNWEMADFVFGHLDLNLTTDAKIFPILEYLCNQCKGGGRPTQEDLLHHFNDVELSAFIVHELNAEWELVDLRRWASDCIRTIKREEIQKKIDAVREQIRETQKLGQPVVELLQHCMALEEQKKNLSTAFSVENSAGV